MIKLGVIDFLRRFLRVNRLIEISCLVITTIATVFVAASSIGSFKVSSELSEISRGSSEFQKKVYLTDNRPRIKIKTYLNIEKISMPADNIRNSFPLALLVSNDKSAEVQIMGAEYSSFWIVDGKDIAIQEKVPFKPLIDSDMLFEGTETYTVPEINITGFNGHKESAKLKILINVFYKGSLGIDPSTYSSTLELVFEKQRTEKDANLVLVYRFFSFGRNHATSGDV